MVGGAVVAAPDKAPTAGQYWSKKPCSCFSADPVPAMFTERSRDVGADAEVLGPPG